MNLMVMLVGAVLLALLAVGVAVAVMLSRSGGTPAARTGGPVGATADDLERLVRHRQDHLQEERRRILQMVQAGRISDAEGDRLLATLERETVTRDCPYCGGSIHVAAVKCKHCRRILVAPAGCAARLTRSHNRMLAGVCGGFAAYLGIDPSLVRILTVLLLFATGFVPGTLAYLVLALVLPPPGAPPAGTDALPRA